jgi:hypothetical protein
MLGKARQILVSELTFALKLDEETAEAKLDEVLGKGEPAVAIDDESMPDRTPVSKTPAKKAVKAAKAPAAKAAAKAPAKAPAKKAAKAAKAPAKAK